MSGYPSGGTSTAKGGEGMFRDAETGQGIHVWVDIDLSCRYSMIKQMEDEGAKIAIHHWSPEVQLIVLSPRSIAIFDMYCHPNWLTPSARCFYQMRQARAAEKGEEFQEGWRSKVLLKETWWKECINAGRFLGEADNWGGQRAGGPPVAPSGADLATAVSKNPSFTTQASPPDPNSSSSTAAKTSQPRHSANGNDNSLGRAGTQNVVEATSPTDGGHAVTSPTEVTHGAAPRTSPATAPLVSDAPPGVPDDSEEEEEVEEVEEVEEREVERDALAAMPKEAADVTPAPGYAPSPSASVYTRPPTPQTSEPQPSRLMDDPISDTVPDTSRIFDGLRLWVDPKRPNRSELLGRIKQAGGTIATDYPNATHVLVQDYALNTRYWDGVTRTLTKTKGVWFMHMPWATKSLDERVIQPELAFCVPGGTPSHMESETEDKPTLPPSSQPTWTGKGQEPRMSTEDLAGLFKREWDRHEGSLVALLDHLYDKYGVYTRSHWGNLFDQYRNGTGRFKNMRIADPPPEQVSPKQVPPKQAPPTPTSYALPTKAVERPPTVHSQPLVQRTAEMEEFFDDTNRYPESAPAKSKNKKKKHMKMWPEFQPKDARETGLEEAYQFALEKGIHRRKMSSDLINKSGIADQEEWIAAYTMHHDRRAASKLKQAAVLEILKSRQKEFDQARQRASPDNPDKPKGKNAKFANLLHPLVTKHKAYDFDGWIDVHERWRSGKWPPRLGLEAANPAQDVATGPATHHIALDQRATQTTSPKRHSTSTLSSHDDNNDNGNASSAQGSAGQPDPEIPDADGTFSRPMRIGIVPKISAPSTNAPSNNAPAAKMSKAELATIICENYDKLADLGIYKLGFILAQKYSEFPRYTAAKWALIANEWEHGLGRFVKFGKEYDPVGGIIAAKKAQMASESSNAGQSGAERELTPAGMSTATGKPPVVSTEDMIRIFTKYRPLTEGPAGISIPELAKMMESNHGGYSAGTWANRYRQWTRGEGRFAAKSSAPRAVDSRGTKRSHESPVSSTTEMQGSQSKRPKNAYSEEEERRMAAHIVSRLPEETLPRPGDWRAFAEANPQRSLAGYTEHYRGYKARIDGYVREIQAKLGHEDRDRAISVASDDSSVVALDTPEKRATELIDITLLDDNEQR